MSSLDAVQRARDIAARLRNFGDSPDEAGAPGPKRQKRSGFSNGPAPSADGLGGNCGGFSDSGKNNSAAAAMAAVAALRELAARGGDVRLLFDQYDVEKKGTMVQSDMARRQANEPRLTSQVTPSLVVALDENAALRDSVARLEAAHRQRNLRTSSPSLRGEIIF